MPRLCTAQSFALLAILASGGAAAEPGKPPAGPAPEARQPEPDAAAAKIARLVAELGHDDWAVREQASAALRALGEPALAALEPAAKSPDPEVRARAGELLLQIRRDLAFSRMGNTLIAETYADRVVEVDREGQEVWVLDGLDKPVVAQRFGAGLTLVAEREGGRVTVFDRDKQPLWRMENLGRVWHAQRLANGHVLMTCCGEELFSDGRVVEVDENKKTVWEAKDLAAPRSCQRLADGRTLIVERKKDRVIELDREGQVVWKAEGLHAPLFAARLAGGNTLVAEWSPARAVELDKDGKEVWSFAAGLSGTSTAQRLAGGETLVTDFGTGRVVQVDPKGEAVWEKSGLNSPCWGMRLERAPEADPKAPGAAGPKAPSVPTPRPPT
jgi:hypothetical protein